MTHVEIIIAPDRPDDDDPHSDTGLNEDAQERLRIVLIAAGFRLVSGPFARPPLAPPFDVRSTGVRRFPGHDVKSS